RRRQGDVPAWPAAKEDVEEQGELPAKWLGTRDRAYVSSRDRCPAGQSDVHTEGQVDNVRGTADVTWLKARPVERDVQVGLEHRDDGREQGTWVLRSVNEIPQRDIEVVHRGQVPVRGNRNRAESLEITSVTLEDVAEERLKLEGVDSLGRRVAGEGRGARGKAHVHAPGDQVAPVVLPEHILEERAKITRRCVRAAQAGKPAGDRERVDGDPEADRGLLIQEGLLEAEDLAVDLHVLDWCPELTIKSGIDPVEVVEADPDAIDRSGILVIGDLEAPDRRHDCGDRSPRQECRVIARPGNRGWNRRGDRGKAEALATEQGPTVTDHGKCFRGGAETASEAGACGTGCRPEGGRPRGRSAGARRTRSCQTGRCFRTSSRSTGRRSHSRRCFHTGCRHTRSVPRCPFKSRCRRRGCDSRACGVRRRLILRAHGSENPTLRMLISPIK